MQATGAVTAAGLLGSASGVVAADEGFDEAFVNYRVVEASKAWARGYRGRPDRALGQTDSGLDARHPDLGPWNGIGVDIDDGDVSLYRYEFGDFQRTETGKSESFSGVIGPGVTNDLVGPMQDVPTETTVTHEFDAPSDVDVIDATMTWTPPSPGTPLGEFGMDIELYLDEQQDDGSWERIARSTQPGQPEHVQASVTPGTTYRFVVETWANLFSRYEIVGTYYRVTGEPAEIVREGVTADEVFAGVDPADVTSDTPKTVGWFTTGDYGGFERPLDGNGHGTHVASIAGGSGRASEIDASTVRTEEPYAVLAAGDVLDYEIDAPADSGVFVSAFGAGLELVIEGPDGQQLDRSTFQEGDNTPHDDRTAFGSNAVAEAATVHGSGTATYTAYVRPMSGEAVAVARCERVCVGAFETYPSAVGDRVPGDGVALHSGVAPNAALVCMQGLSGASTAVGDHAAAFAETFNLRSVNMSWGWQGGAPAGAAGGTLSTSVEDVRKMAEEGILTVAAAGNSTTPAQSSAPALADEAISVVATGPLDGIVDYSSGGIGAVDEDGNSFYGKPDVTAPGGGTTDLVNAAAAGDPSNRDGTPREYVELAGTSMASPYVNGLAGLVAHALEDGPLGDVEGVGLPAPPEAGKADAMRLKQVILATASETVFTAAPHHKGHPATYEHGGRDPYEGYGRVNPDAAVDAVSRPLVDTAGLEPDQSTSASFEEVLGLDVPSDSRAVAGFVRGNGGTLAASVEFSHLSGGNKGMAKDTPHLDLFVYDLANPAANGEPAIVTSAMGTQGAASVSTDLPDGGAYAVVAKLVNVPGVVTGYDVQVRVTLDVSYTAPPKPSFSVAGGSRQDDGSAFTGGQTDQIDLTVDDPDAEAEVRDVIPVEWNVLTEYSDDVARVEESEGRKRVVFRGTAPEGTKTSYTYMAEAPSDAESTNSYSFGPAEARAVADEDSFSNPDAWVDVPGTSETNYVVGQST